MNSDSENEEEYIENPDLAGLVSKHYLKIVIQIMMN